MKLAPKYIVTPIDPSRVFGAVECKVEYRYEDFVTDEGKVIKRKVEGSGHIVSKTAETHGGFMVRFPNGNSVRVTDEDHLKSLGFDVAGGLVDLDSGEEVPVDADGRVDFRAMIATTALHKANEGQLDLLGEKEEA